VPTLHAPAAGDPLPDLGTFYIVMNEGSGHHAASERAALVRGVMEEAGQAFEILPVDDPSHLAAVAQRAVRLACDNAGVVVAAGGDGTINTVAQAALGCGRPFAVLPQGTFNFTGRAQGLPTDIEAAARALLTASPRPVQVGLVNGRVFLVNASLGLYPRLIEDREAWKRRFGRSRLVAAAAGVSTLFRNWREISLRLEVEGQPTALRTPTLVVANNLLQLEQLGLPEAEAVRAGQLVALAVKPTTSWGLLWVAVQGALGRLGAVEALDRFTFATMMVRLRRSWRRVKVAIDGEVVWLRPPLVFRVADEPLQMLVPHDDTAAAEPVGEEGTRHLG
jgi:diacylglycerol kinase family enzyme